MQIPRVEKDTGGLINDKGSFSDFGRNQSSQGQQRVPARGCQDLDQQRTAPFSNRWLRPAFTAFSPWFPGPLEQPPSWHFTGSSILSVSGNVWAKPVRLWVLSGSYRFLNVGTVH